VLRLLGFSNPDEFLADANAPPLPNPELLKVQLDQQKLQQDGQIAQARLAQEAQIAQGKLQVDGQRSKLELIRAQMQQRTDQMELAGKQALEADRLKHDKVVDGAAMVSDAAEHMAGLGGLGASDVVRKRFGGSVFSEADHPRSNDGKFSATKGEYNGAELTTSQHYRNEDIVAQKLRKKDFGVSVSPEFEIEGKKYRSIIDGHHSLSAALEAGVDPYFSEANEQDDDSIHHLRNGNIEGFLQANHKGEGDYVNPVTGDYTFKNGGFIWSVGTGHKAASLMTQ